MSDYYRDLFDGAPGNLNRHLPDYGDPLLAPTVDFADGTYMQDEADNLLTALVRDGDGFVRVNNTIAPSGIVIAKITPLSGNHATEIKLNCSPTLVSDYLSVIARTSPEAANPPNGVNFIGGYFSFSSDSITATRWESLEGGSGYGSSGSSAANYPDGPYDITLRVEFVDSTVNFLVDGVVILTFTITDPAYSVIGDIYIVFEMGTFTGDLSDMKFASLRVTSMPEVGFWTNQVKVQERFP